MFAGLRFTGRLAPASAATALLCVLFGCAAQNRVALVPAPNAMLASQPGTAKAAADGVSITVQPNDWNGRPRNLDAKVTPLKVTIRNHSGHPLRVGYDDFSLVTPHNRAYAAIPPADIRGHVITQLQDGSSVVDAAFRPGSVGGASLVRVDDDEGEGGAEEITPEFDSDNFYAAPYWGYAYPGIGWWSGYWGAPYGYYNMYYPYMRRYHLPTRSMLRKGIPEGVVDKNGYISGFLYFQKPSKSASQPLEFTARLIDARTGRQFGTLEIPFDIR